MIVYYDMIQLRKSIQMYNSYHIIQKQLFLFEFWYLNVVRITIEAFSMRWFRHHCLGNSYILGNANGKENIWK